MASKQVTLEPSIQDVATVISILPILLMETKPGLIPGEYRISAVKNMYTDVETLIVGRAKFPVYIDENRPAIIVPEPADRVCAAIVRDFKTAISHYTPGVSEPGLFWTHGAMTPGQAKDQLIEELALARKLQEEWFKRLVAAADDDWERYHQRAMISGLQKIACSTLRLDKQWNLDAEVTANLRLVKCKFCFADIAPEAIICQHCRGVLDMVRYKAEYVQAEV